MITFTPDKNFWKILMTKITEKSTDSILQYNKHVELNKDGINLPKYQPKQKTLQSECK